ncbi:hypothetical protein R3P38DRAFT_2951693 [Favolaschia claudopus]|uniref:CxC5 like cysteine cluster associated with KDZ domain-containing protein n=1 Tax=Favolaschia claudopus TaxID=2862362 RepID=A0AAW0BFQ3_9AGAR
MPALDVVVSRLSKFPQLSNSVTVSQLESFIRLASRLQHIIVPSNNNEQYNLRDLSLPDPVVGFLAAVLNLAEPTILLCWAAFADCIAERVHLPSENEALALFGSAFGIVADCLNPPATCSTDTCNDARLTKRQEFTGTLFTLHRGVVPITIASLYCHHCHTTYHHNYKIHRASQPSAQREYYGGVPEHIQVSMHFVVERELVVFWETQMVFSHTSAESASRIYNLALRGSQVESSDRSLSPDTIWDAFFLHALLRDAAKRQTPLSVDHNGLQMDRLNDALRARNARMVGTGQDQWAHACNNCQKILGHARLSACVTDGVTLGHPCCGVHNCQVALANQKAWYCPTHSKFRFVCAIQGCNAKSEAGWRTCSASSHRKYEAEKRAEGKAMFALRARQARHLGQATLRAPASDIDYLDEVLEDDTCDLQPISSQSSTKIRGRLGRRWTHNEQLMVRCCGIIISRATFFGSEAITSVKQFIHVTFPDNFPGSLPSFIWYDNNCQLLRHLFASTDPRDARLADVGFPVDVFHASRKHKDSDEFCVFNCSPVTFPELMDGKNWVFNSSAAEQTNKWFGQFQPIVKEMAVLRYNFFLDEMISLRNEWMVERLRLEGHRPHFIPLEDLEVRLPLSSSV